MKLGATALLVFASSAAAALAHDTWLAPDLYHRISPGTVTLSLTSGMDFPALDYAIKPERIAVAKGRDASGRTFDMQKGREAEHALAFTERAADGVTTFWVVLHPRPSQLASGQVREYVEHLGLADPEAVIAAWESKQAEELRYRYIKYSKTFVRAGAAARGRTWGDATGMRLELVPEDDPARLVAGGTLRFLLVEEGRPRSQYPVSVIHDGSERVYRTDGEGGVTIDLPTAGPYLVRATTLVQSAEPGVEWDVHFTTVAVEAHAQRQ